MFTLITRRLSQIPCKAVNGPYVWVLGSKFHLGLSISCTFKIFSVHNYFIAFICIFNGFLLGTLIQKNNVKPDFSLGNLPYFLKVAREGRRLKSKVVNIKVLKGKTESPKFFQTKEKKI